MNKIKILIFINIVSSFGLILFGAIVNSSGATLSCPEWPSCYGDFIPVGVATSVSYHLYHRILASIVALLSFFIMLFAFKTKKDQLKKKSTVGFGLVLIQAIVGALAAIYKLPTIVAVLHLSLSVLFIFNLFRIWHLAGAEESTEIEESLKNEWSSFTFHLFILSGFLYFVQMLMGALVKHSGASSSCGVSNFSGPLCFENNSIVASFWPVAEQAQLHIAHRYFALVVLIGFFYSCHFLFHFMKKTSDKRTTVLLALIPLSLIAQVALGVASLKNNLNGTYTASHMLLAMVGIVIFSFALKGLNDVFDQIEDKKKHSILSDFFDLSKPRLTLLVVVSSYIGLMLAPESINFFKAFLGLVAITLVVVGAAAMNCYLEREVDGRMDRTKDRPLPSKRMNSSTALIYGGICSVIGLGVLFIKFNTYVGFASAFASFSYVFAYTPLKTRSTISLLVGAIPGAIPALLGYLLVTNELNLAVISLFCLIFFWQFPHFFAISIFHGKDYAKANIQVHTNKMSFDSAQKFILYSTPFVVLISYVPLVGDKLNSMYFYAASLTGLAFTWTAVINKEQLSSKDGQRYWARRYFFASIIYLPLVMFAMVILR